MATSEEFEFVNESELDFSRRGRKSQVSQALVTAISKMKKGQALKLSGMTVNPSSPKAKTEKARISAQIRQAGRLAKRSIGIRWSVAGVPQVVITE